MATAGEEIKKIQKKLSMLKFTRDETTRVLEKNTVRALERHIRGFNQQIDDVHSLMMTVQELKIEADEDPTDVREWSQKIEGELAEFEDNTEDGSLQCEHHEPG